MIAARVAPSTVPSAPRQRKKRRRETSHGVRCGILFLKKFGQVLNEAGRAYGQKKSSSQTRRHAGSEIQGRVEVRPARQAALAMRGVTEAARARGEKSMGARLAAELMEAAERRGTAMKKRDDVHRMAEANKAFSHYRFYI